MADKDIKVVKETSDGSFIETTLQVEEYARIHIGTTPPTDPTKLWLDIN